MSAFVGDQAVGCRRMYWALGCPGRAWAARGGGALGQPEMSGPARVMVMRTTQRRSLIMAAR